MAINPRRSRARTEKIRKLDASSGLGGLAGTKAGGWRQYEAVLQKKDEEVGGVHDYEHITRSFNKYQMETKEKLPIKTMDGLIYQVEADSAEENDKCGGDIENGNDQEGRSRGGERVVEKEAAGIQRWPILQLKEELAHIALTLNEDPEENTHLFRRLRKYCDSHIPTTKKLALASQCSIFKSIIPGYRIRPLTPGEKITKVSREVRKLRTYEQALLHSYQQYVNTLASLARGLPSSGAKPAKLQQPTRTEQELALVAVSCTAELLFNVSHFNFRTDLLQILVDRLSFRHVDPIYEKARNSLEELFRMDQDGATSFDAVRMLVKMFKSKNYLIHESVLNTFLSLRLLFELDLKAPQFRVDQNLSIKAGVTRRKRKHKDDLKQQFKTKRQRRQEREQTAVLSDLREAEAVVSHEERERMQSETLKLVFGVYVGILKQGVGGNLLAATLEGLAKFAHLVNVEFFATLLSMLRDLLKDSPSSPYFPRGNCLTSTYQQPQTTRESLLCITAAFTLLSGQQNIVCRHSATSNQLIMPLDLTFFTSRLFTLLLPLSLNPDLEFNHKSLWLLGPLPYNQGMTKPHTLSSTLFNVATETALLIRCLCSILTPSHPPHPAPSRVAAFTKRLLSFSLQSPEKSSVASLGIVAATARKNRGPAGYAIKAVFQLGEKAGDGYYHCWIPEEIHDEGVPNSEFQEKANVLGEDCLLNMEERVNPFVGTAWEVDLLRRHYSPKVRATVQEVMSILGGNRGSSV